MTFLKCQRDDPFTKRVREMYRANIVRAPRAGIDPLDVIASKGDHVEIRGDLPPLIADPPPIQLPAISSLPAPDISGGRSTTLDAKLGAELGAKFLSALGVPIPGGNLDVSLWQGATEFSFEVRDVRERQIDVNHLGQALRGRRIDRSSPAAAIFFEQDAPTMSIVSRTLTSPEFAIHATSQGGQSVDISVDAIRDVVGKANAKVSWSREVNGAVSFKGAQAVTFALAAVPCKLRSDGTFSIGLEISGIDFLVGSDPKAGSIIIATHMPIINEDGLLVLDE